MCKPLIGELLLQKGEITQNQLNSALEYQQQNGGLIGIILLQQNIINEQTLVDCLAFQADRLTHL